MASRVLSVIIGTLALAATAAAAPPPAIVTGQDAGWPDVRAWLPSGAQAQTITPWGDYPLAFSPYSTYQQGVRVAVGDVDGDGKAEIVTAPGKSGFTELRVFDGRSYQQERALLPFKDAVWWNGAFVSTGDTNADGRDEIVEGLDAGCCTTLHVLDAVGGGELSGWYPFGDRSDVGARVAAGDVNLDGKTEVFSVPLGSNRVTLFGSAGGGALRSYLAFGSEAYGGTAIASGDLAGDGRAELVAAASTQGGVHVKIIDAESGATVSSFFPYGSLGASAVGVATADVDGDRRTDVVVSAQLADGTQVKALDRTGRELASFYVLEPGIVPGASLAAGDLDGDGRAEIVLGGGPTQSPWPPVANGPDQRIVIYRADGSRVGSFTAYPGLFQGGVRVALADLDRDRRPEMITAPGPGMAAEIGVFSQTWLSGRDWGTRVAHFPAFEESFQGGATVAAGDVDGDGSMEIVVGAGPGRAPEVRVFDASGRLESSFLAFEPSYRGGISVAAGDLNVDGRAEIVAGTLAAPARIQSYSGGTPFGPLIFPFPSAGPGVQVGVADLLGNGRAFILAAAAGGDEPLLRAIDPHDGSVARDGRLEMSVTSGIRAAGGDLDGDGRDEVVVTTGWGGDGLVRILGGRLIERDWFRAYSYQGWGMSVAVRARLGLPIAATSRTVKLTARVRASVIIARFRDADSARGTRRAWVRWGDGTSARGTVISRGGGVYDVRGTKSYHRPGRYAVTVQLTAPGSRSSVAHSKAVVRRTTAQ